MTGAIFRTEWTCRSCLRRVTTVCRGRVRRIEDLVPSGFRFDGDAVLCGDCRDGGQPVDLDLADRPNYAHLLHEVAVEHGKTGDEALRMLSGERKVLA